ILADPLERLRPKTDTTLAIVHASQDRKHRVFWATESGLRLDNGRVRVECAPCESWQPNGLPHLGAYKEMALRDFSLVWIRKDPPFDGSYLKLCWLLALEEKNVPMLNRPSVLLRYHEKMLPFEAAAAGVLKASELVPTHIGSPESAQAYATAGELSDVIQKPFLGFGGGDVKKFSRGQWAEQASREGDMLTQPYLPEITDKGDRRVMFLNGKVVGDFVRLPQPGQYVSNLARGGSAALIPMTAGQKALAQRLGKFLKKRGIDFAGADLIGSRVSEVNITSPTGVLKLKELTGIDVAAMLVAYAERSAQ
ncbi:hypothetical protein K2X33_11955, partial [bacterium]|nr:hypothetical protein [bacterium]